MKTFNTLKFKILMGISLLLIVTTSFALYYSYKLFTEDKRSYIYSNGLKQIDYVSKSLDSFVKESIQKSEYDLILNKRAHIDFKTLATSNSDLLAWAEVRKAETGSLQLDSTEQFKGIFTPEFNKIISSTLNSQSESIKKKKYAYLQINNSPYLLIAFNSQNDFLNVFIYNLKPLFYKLQKDNIFKIKLIFNDQEELKEKFSFLSNVKIFESGTKEIAINNTPFLASYGKVDSNLFAVSYMDKETAFGITKYLIFKTILFGLFLLGLAVTVGVYFSSTITVPLKKFTDMALLISSGNYESEIKIKTSGEIEILQNSFNKMIFEIKTLLNEKENLILKLEDYNKNLELKVEERTRELKQSNDFIKLMINSIDQGFVVFDQSLALSPIISKATHEIFKKPVENSNLIELLDLTNPEEIESLNMWKDIVFEEKLPFESALELGLLQLEPVKDTKSEGYKYIELAYYPMKDEEDKLQNVLMVATDKTLQRINEEKFKESDSFVKMILKILKNKSGFSSFVSEVNLMIERLEKIQDISSTETFDEAQMLIHTLNGGFGLYYINELYDYTRAIEDEVYELKSDFWNKKKEITEIIKNKAEVVSIKFGLFKYELDQLLGTRFSRGENLVEINEEKLFALYDLIKKSHSTELTSYFYQNFILKPIKNYFVGYNDICRTISKKLNKEFDQIKFHNEDLLIDPQPYQELFSVLIHVIKNAMDHGLESTSERLKANKPSMGSIGISFEQVTGLKDKKLNIIIQDDGGGINVEKIKNKLERDHILDKSQIALLSEEELINYIFSPNFSTKDALSLYSGKGVGMSAVKEAVDRLNGSIEVETKLHVGTTFRISVPTLNLSA